MTTPQEFAGAEYPHLVMPLGGIGTGNLAIAADGGLRQWQLHNIGNHAGALPSSFFALRVTRWENPPLDTVRILQSPAPPSTDTPLVTDDVVPAWQRDLLAHHRGVAATTFSATYPEATVRYLDPELPLDVSLQALNPLVPLDVDRSSIPVAMFTFRLVNTDPYPLHGSLGIALQNAVGWDGVSPIDGVAGAGYGGNVNRLRRGDGWTTVRLENPGLADDAPGAGQLVLATDDDATSALLQWQHPDEFLTFLQSRALGDGRRRLDLAPDLADPQRHAPISSVGPSPSGRTWNTGLAVPFQLEPGEERVVRVALAWHFPNRYVNFEQFGGDRPEWGRTQFWLGNHYTTHYADAVDVVDRVRREWDDLVAATRSWTSTLRSSGLDDTTVTHLAAQAVPIRSATCFRAADGRFFGFEGTLGASTVMWSGAYGGSCPMNCTHVWNYAQALARLFPELERDMRETEFDVMQAPEGYVPHRVIVPTYLRQLWDEPIGGPEQPALDGMLGSVLKTYREYRAGAGAEWLARYRPNVTRLMEHVQRHWDPDDTGLLSGIQPSTHDIDLAGHNSFQGTLWLAALRAAEEIERALGDDAAAEKYRDRFERGSRAYDEALFTGEYYVQRLLPGDPTEFQWVDGCLADQLIGQWWAHELGLGHLLPAEHVRTALRSVVRYNLRHGFTDFVHPYRVFADGDDGGLLMCTWPHGGRPPVPTRYADEVWTGSEYQVAAHCLREGLVEEGQAVLAALWTRYDGRRRNPFNEVECGDHYVRALAGWSVLEAITGFGQDSAAGRLTFRHPDVTGHAVPFLSSHGWGSWSATGDGLVLECSAGRVDVRELTITGAGVPDYTLDVDATATRLGDGTRLVLTVPLSITTGERIVLTARPW